MAHSLGRPLEGHYPNVHRIKFGSLRGTGLSCSCGWKPNPEAYHKTRVSNYTPSQGGKSAANAAYQGHVAEVLAESAEVVS